MDNRSKNLLTKPIGELIVNYSIPAIVGMMVMSLYNIADTYFVGKYVGKLGIAGIAVVMPYNSILLAVVSLIAIGAASLIARSVGADDPVKVNKTFNITFLLTFITAAFFTLFGFLSIDHLIYLFGGTDAIYPFAHQYLQVTIAGSVFAFFIMTSNTMVRSEGNARVAMRSMIFSSLLNIVLDYWFIAVLDLGMRGAAFATVLSQAIAGAYILYYFFSDQSIYQFRLADMKPEWLIVKEIFSIGLAAFARQIGNAIMNIVVNQAFRVYGGELYIAAYGIVIRLVMFATMPVFGIVQGLMPVLGTNYGASKYRRSIEAIDKSAGFASLLSLSFFLLFIFFPRALVGAFTDDPELMEYAAYALVIITMGFSTVGYQIVGSSMFQSIGKAKPSFFLSLLRQVIILVPLVNILPVYFGTNGILYSFVISDLTAFLITFIIVKREKFRIRNME